MTKIIPAFYINVTDKCNMKCMYCSEYGENHEETEQLIDQEQLNIIVEIAASKSINTFRISGGEPMIYPDRVFSIIKKLNILGINDIILNTNGYNTFKYTDQLKLLSINKIKISLDSIDEYRFEKITGTKLLQNVLKSIETVRKNRIPLEINFVVMKKTIIDMWAVIEYCFTRCISLKLLDLIQYNNLVRGEMDSDKFWESEYLDMQELMSDFRNRFGRPQKVSLSGNRGIPMWQFETKGSATLTVKTGTEGSTFGGVCRSCYNFPCHEGLFHISLSAAGRVTPCRLRRDLAIDMKPLNRADIEKVLDQMLAPFQDTLHCVENASTSHLISE